MLKHLLIPFLITAFCQTASAGREEQELSRISKMLKPISDSQWNEIAGPKVSDTYEVQKGDNLWNISKSLFANPFYWPKVWSFNNAIIGNPHQIEPGQSLVFNPGSSSHLPSLSDQHSGKNLTQGSENYNGVSDAEKRIILHEYDKLSPEMWAPEDPPQFTAQFEEVGFEKDLRVDLESQFNFRVPAVVNDAVIPHLGEVAYSRREGAHLSTGEFVFVKSDGNDLQVGMEYSILSEPRNIQNPKSERVGFAYFSKAEIKILGVKDGLYISEIVRGNDIIERGDKVYPLLPLVPGENIKPARAPVEAIIMMDERKSVSNASQYSFVFFDRGLEDGVEVGNVFRVYDYFDPVTQKKITESDFLISADVLVVHATAEYSTGLVLKALGTVSSGSFGVLLTNTRDFQKERSVITKSVDTKESMQDPELDELDHLDEKVGEGLGRQEEEEVKELDQWDRTNDMDSTVPSDAEAPSEISSDTVEPMEEPPPTTEPLEPLDSEPSSPVNGSGGEAEEMPPPPAEITE